MELKIDINKYREDINNELLKTIASSPSIDYRTMESMSYSVRAGGKRLRPLLLLTCFLHFNKGEFDVDDIMPFVLAIEYIHTYSLIHDDLPAMDNDDLRRGLPTNHIVYGEATAILAGDGLLNFAFESISCGFKENFTLEQYKSFAKALKLIGECSGASGMIKGQMLDMMATKETNSLEYLKEIHLNKTGKLFKASICIGGILSFIDNKTMQSLEELADLVGLGFQIQDDLLDYLSTEEELGKPIGSDEKNNKLTYVTFVGIEKSKEIFQKTKEEIIKSLENLGAKDSLFGYMILESINKI